MMKTILKANITLIFSLIFLFIVNVNAQENGQWEILNEGILYRSIDFINDQLGWIAGEGTLLKTEDGGETWNFVTMDSTWNFGKIDFVNETIGWAKTNSYQIIKTMDGGHTWFIQKELNINNEDDMEMVLHAVNETTVYASVWDNGSDLFRIIKTVDGGTTWKDISPYNRGKTINSIWFQDHKRGIFLGSTTYTSNDGLWYEPFQGIILRTNNGGNTWDETIVPEFREMYGFKIINDSTAYFLATNSNRTKYFLCITTDNLNSWSIIYQDTRSINSFYCLDDMTFFAIMTDNTWTSNLMKSIDGGITWEKKQTIWETQWVSGEIKIYFRNADVGLFVGAGRLFGSEIISFFSKSIDGGENWTIQKMCYPSMNDVYFFDKNSGIVFGGWAIYCHSGCYLDGDLFFTNDGGKTWEWGSFGDGGVKYCFFINASTGFIFVQKEPWDSNVYKTRDAGKNWTKVYENNYDSTGFIFWGNEISFLNQEIGWVVGNGDWAEDSCGAAILGTSDGGETWDLVWKLTNSNESDYHFNSIHTVNTKAWAVGESGMIVKYTEQDQWQVQSSITDLPLNEVFFRDENHGWISGGYMHEDNIHLKLFKTDNGGENWQDIPNINYQINDIFFEDSLHGWAVGSDTSDTGNDPPGRGVILYTSNGGENWTVQVEGLSAPLNAIHFKDGYGWAVGGKGLVLRTDDGVNWIEEKHITSKIPHRFELSQNYPNPFNPSTTIEFTLPKSEFVELRVYNILGKEVSTLVSKKLNQGNHTYTFDGKNLASGIYYYQLVSGNYREVKKMILLR